MIDTAITFFLYWLAAGSFIWMICDPARLTEKIEHWYIGRRGRLPRRSVVIVGHAGAILAAPVVPFVMLVKLHRRVWGA